jgi:hypothetical protein
VCRQQSISLNPNLPSLTIIPAANSLPPIICAPTGLQGIKSQRHLIRHPSVHRRRLISFIHIHIVIPHEFILTPL